MLEGGLWTDLQRNGDGLRGGLVDPVALQVEFDLRGKTSVARPIKKKKKS